MERSIMSLVSSMEWGNSGDDSSSSKSLPPSSPTPSSPFSKSERTSSWESLSPTTGPLPDSFQRRHSVGGPALKNELLKDTDSSDGFTSEVMRRPRMSFPGPGEIADRLLATQSLDFGSGLPRSNFRKPYLIPDARVKALVPGIDRSMWSADVESHRKMLGVLQTLSPGDLLRKLESSADWPSHLLDLRHALHSHVQEEESSKAALGDKNHDMDGVKGVPSPMVVLKSPDRMLHFYSFFQQLLLDTLLYARSAAGGFLALQAGVRGTARATVLQSVLDIVPPSGCLGTLGSESLTEGTMARKTLLTERVALLCRDGIAQMDATCELVARVLTIVRQDRLVSGSKTVSQLKNAKLPVKSVEQQQPLAPYYIGKETKALAAADVDRILWLIELGQIQPARIGSTGGKLAEALLGPIVGGTKGIIPSTAPSFKSASDYPPKGYFTLF